MKKHLDIALLIKTESEFHRNILMGIGQFAEEAGGWRFTIPPADAEGEVLLPDNWNGDGIIFRSTSRELEEKVKARHVPCVNVSWLRSSPEIPKVISDEKACALMAAQFILEKQYENVGYVGFPPWMNYSTIIEDTLAEKFLERGHKLHSFELCHQEKENKGIRHNVLVQWLHSLPKPVAIVVWSSVTGHAVTKASRECGIDVPQSIAILCIEHDPLWSLLATIPLSNIDQDPWRIGYSAAKLLHSIMKGALPPTQPIRIVPISVVQRLSTEASAVKDPILSDALKHIYSKAKTGITVKEVVNELGISRRALESKFKKDLNCTPAAYIRKIQLMAVAKLLRTTKLNISAIANRTGFVYPEVLMRSFKREFGVTPMQFRGAGSVKSLESPRGEE